MERGSHRENYAMNQYSEGQRVLSRHGHGVLIVARTDPYGVFALASTDGRMPGSPGGSFWCHHANTQVSYYEYLGGENEGARGVIDRGRGRECGRPIELWDRAGRHSDGSGDDWDPGDWL